MIPALSIATIAGTFSAGLSYGLKATALDQKVFDFAAPHFKLAFAFGAIYSITDSALDGIIQNLTNTSFKGEYMQGYRWTEMHSDHPRAYKFGRVLAKIISAVGTVYVLRQMNYSISYRFAAVCMIPSLIHAAAKAHQDSD